MTFRPSLILWLAASLSTGVNLFALDQNNDQISDVYAKHYGLPAHSGEANPDGDEHSNYVESVWGTDPFDNKSVFRASSVQVTNSIFDFEMPTVAGKRYQFQGLSDLNNAGWMDVDIPFTGTGVAVHMLTVLPISGTDKFFWRVHAVSPVDEDNDGLDTFEEVLLGTSDSAIDSDGDNVGDLDEFLADLNPALNFDADVDGLPDDWETFWDDRVAVFPSPVVVQLTYNQSITKTLYLNNPVAPAANFTVTVTGNLASGQSAYVMSDSITGSAIYDWTEISATGTLLSAISTADDSFEVIPLNNFDFPLHGITYNQIFVSSNGQILFGSGDDPHSNLSIPNTSPPNAFIAAFWDDLKPSLGGTIHYLEDGNELIVQFQSVRRYSGAGDYTFQVVLHQDGDIDIRYKSMTGAVDSATIGIESADGQQGIQVAFNDSYLQGQALVAIRLSPEPAYFVDVSPQSGTSPVGGLATLAVDFNSFSLEPGTYQAEIEIAHTGTGSSPWAVPAILEIINPPSQIQLTSPEDGFTLWSDESVTLSATASDDDFGIERVEFFANESKQGEDLTGSYYSYNWQPPAPGVYSVTARAVDRLDAVTISESITVIALEDVDLDRMEDGWEIENFGGLQGQPLDDFDADGASNLHEYEAEFDPTDSTQTPANISSVITFIEPVDGASFLHGDDVALNVSFSDSDFGGERIDFYVEGTLVDTDNSVYSSASGTWQNPSPGIYTLTATATDRYGAKSSITVPVAVIILADADGDRMEDGWEAATFGDLAQEASADFDLDGFPNVFEYHHGSDANDAQSFPVFSASQTATSPITGIGEVHYYRVDGTSNTTYEKSTIQAAINAANDFDVIEVLPNADAADAAVYRESLSVSDRVYLFAASGARNTIVEVEGLNQRALHVSDEAVISGLTFQGANPSSTSFYGGGLYVSISGDFNRPRFIGCRFIDNTVGGNGGGVYVYYGDPMFISCTIAGNLGGSGNALYNARSANNITLVNTLLWNPGASAEITGYSASVTFDHSLSRDDTTGSVLIDGVDQLTFDPRLAFDDSLIAGSLARDSGTLSLYSPFDLDGEALTDGIKDIGADEFTDSDGDDLPDWIEAFAGIDLSAGGDQDNDTLTNLDDFNAGANPFSNDTDGDGLFDGDELYGDGTHGDTDGYVTEPNNADTDDDGLDDGWEVDYGFNPTEANAPTADTDGDGLSDGQEFSNGSNPLLGDTDGDGMPDLYEYNNGLDLSTDDTALDQDADDLDNLEEYQIGTSPVNRDSDGDYMPDGWETLNGLDPLSASDVDGDGDADGLSNYEEYLNGTNPSSTDSDADGTQDGQEVAQGSDPNDPSDNGEAPEAEKIREVSFSIYGDYASWEITVTGLEPDTRVQKFHTQDVDSTATKSLKLHADTNYDVSMRWLKGVNDEWYCWQSQIDGKPMEQTYNDYDPERIADVAEFFMVADTWLVDNRDGLLTAHVHTNDDSAGNIAGGLNATLLKVDVEFKNSKMQTWKSVRPDSSIETRIGVIKGDTVEFQIADVGSIPTSELSWSGEEEGTGASISVTFDELGEREVILEIADTEVARAIVTVAEPTGPGETAWVLAHPSILGSVQGIRDEATEWTQANLDNLGGGWTNGRADAARHSYWNGVMTLFWGADYAEGLGTAHEVTGLSNTPSFHNSTVMDLENNATGRGLASPGMSLDQLRLAVRGVLDPGGLTILDEISNENEKGLLQQSDK